MPRIRSLKPEITSDVKLARVSRDARLTFIYAITQADDLGLLAGSHRQLLGALYPLDDDVTVPLLLSWIEELVAVEVFRWRATRDGVPVIEILNWSKHQRIDNAGRSQLGALLADLPVDPSASPDLAESRGDSPRTAAKNPPLALHPRSGLSATRGGSPLGPPTTDHGSPITDHQLLVADAQTRLTVAANKGLAEHDDPRRRQPIARIMASSGKSLEAAESITQAGVPIAFAESAVYEIAKSHTADGEVKHLTYFTKAVIRAWEEHQETERSTASERPAKRARAAKPPPQHVEYPEATTAFDPARFGR